MSTANEFDDLYNVFFPNNSDEQATSSQCETAADLGGQTPCSSRNGLVRFSCTGSAKDLRHGITKNLAIKVDEPGSRFNRAGDAETVVEHFFNNYVGNQDDVTFLRSELAKRNDQIKSLNDIIVRQSDQIENSVPDFHQLLEDAARTSLEVKNRVKCQILDAFARNTIDKQQKDRLIMLLKN